MYKFVVSLLSKALAITTLLSMSNASDRPKPSPIVQELCQKLKIQLDQLGVMKDERREEREQEASHRKDLFKALQDQLNDLSR